MESGITYHLKKIQLHSPSEHTVGDNFYPLEIEFIHEEATGKILIVSVFANMGKMSPSLKPILDKLAHNKNATITFDPAALLPEKHGYFSYTGSLTSPPCTEGVEWRVFKQPIEISKAQLVAITAITGRNSRNTQPVYMRVIQESTP
jgi:carbonic anhydrase